MKKNHKCFVSDGKKFTYDYKITDNLETRSFKASKKFAPRFFENSNCHLRFEI